MLIHRHSLLLPEVMHTDSKQEATAYVDVAVATLWTAPDILRDVDAPSASNPVHARKWKDYMTYDEQVQLSGDGMLETQALYGNKVTLLDKQGDMVKVAVEGQPSPDDENGYSGWMPAGQLGFTDEYDVKANDAFVLITSPTAFLYEAPLFNEDRQGLELSYNTRLPYLDETNMTYHVMKPDGKHAWVYKQDSELYESQSDIPEPTKEDLLETGKKFLGLHYLWAGMSGFGFDCSGFTFTIHQAHGITIPRDSSVQANYGKPVNFADIQKGDLIFFAHDKGEGAVHHVSMYAGDGMMIHSPNSKKNVEIIPVKTEGYYEEITGIRRYLLE